MSPEQIKLGTISPSTLRDTATLIRTVGSDSSANMVITVPESPAPTFKCALLPPKSASAPATDGPPRSIHPSDTIYYHSAILGKAQPIYGPGTRLSIKGVEYELIGDSRAMRLGLTTKAYRADLLPVSVIWPLLADLHELGGEVVTEKIPFALWEPTGEDRVATHGLYDDLSAEAPVDYLAQLKVINREVIIGTRKFRIAAAKPQARQPHVALRLTAVDA